MVKNHLKRITSPQSWAIKRKKTKFIVRPRGYLNIGMPLSLILTEFLGLADTRKEVKKIVQNGKILIDGRVVKDERRPLLLMSVMQIQDVGAYRLLFNSRGKLYLKNILSKSAKRKFCKVTSKKLVKGGKIQLGFHEGANLLTEDKNINVHDTVVFDPSKNVEKHLKFEKGSRVFLIGGNGVGNLGTVEMITPNTAVKINEEIMEIDKKNIFVIDTEIEVDQNESNETN